MCDTEQDLRRELAEVKRQLGVECEAKHIAQAEAKRYREAIEGLPTIPRTQEHPGAWTPLEAYLEGGREICESVRARAGVEPKPAPAARCDKCGIAAAWTSLGASHIGCGGTIRATENDPAADALRLGPKPEPAKEARPHVRITCSRCRQDFLVPSGGVVDVAGRHMTLDDALCPECAHTQADAPKPAPNSTPPTMLICLTCRRAIAANDDQGRRTHSCKRPRWAQYEVTPDAALPPGPSGVGSATGANPTAPAPEPPPIVAWVCRKCGETFADWLGSESAKGHFKCTRVTNYGNPYNPCIATEFCGGELVRCVEQRKDAP